MINTNLNLYQNYLKYKDALEFEYPNKVPEDYDTWLENYIDYSEDDYDDIVEQGIDDMILNMYFKDRE